MRERHGATLRCHPGGDPVPTAGVEPASSRLPRRTARQEVAEPSVSSILSINAAGFNGFTR